jgi:chromosome segregation ATPase
MLKSFQGKLLSLEDQLGSKDEQIAELQRRLAAKDTIINTVVRQKDTAVAELDTYRTQMAKDDRELKTIEDAAFAKVQAALRVNEARIAELEKSNAQLKALNSRLQSTNDRLQNVVNKRKRKEQHSSNINSNYEEREHITIYSCDIVFMCSTYSLW